MPGPRRVALLAEGVDRNHKYMSPFNPAEVALLAEGVDRNYGATAEKPTLNRSPSSRRAWIEMRLVMVNESRNAGRPPRGGRG